MNFKGVTNLFLRNLTRRRNPPSSTLLRDRPVPNETPGQQLWRRFSGPLLFSAGITLALIGASSPLLADSLSSLEIRGRNVYQQGSGHDKKIYAFFATRNAEVPAMLFPCINCHGLEGLGRPEGGIEPSNITWNELTKPYGHKHQDGRTHSPFDEKSLAAAITLGIDPAGNKLDPAMPRYRIPEQDLKALVAYLKILGTDLSPGLTKSAIKVGVVLPTAGPKASALHVLVQSYFKELNARGGVYGRQIEFVFADAFQDSASYIKSVRHLVEEEKVFALLGIAISGTEDAVFSLLEPLGMPFVMPMMPTTPSPAKRSGFSLLPGLAVQGQALAVFAAEKLKPAPKISVVLPPGGRFDPIIESMVRQAQAQGWAKPLAVRYSGSAAEAQQLVADLAQAGVATLFYFGPARGLTPLMAEAARQKWLPHFFAPGMVSAREVFSIPREFNGRVFLANPTIPKDHQEKALIEFEILRRKYEIPIQHLPMMLSLYATTQVFVEGLRRSGRSLSREKFFQSLEGLSDYETGLTPQISFGPNRRIGSLGAYVLPVDLIHGTFGTDPVWIALD